MSCESGMPVDLRDPALPAIVVRDALGLAPHPEGGHYRELWRDQPASGQRGVGSSILFMLAAGESSHWHRVDAAEIWLWQGGSALTLRVADGEAGWRHVRLGPDLAGGEVLQATVPKHAWQDASSQGGWTVVSCIVTPAFEFAGFEMAAPGWSPPT